MRLNALEQSANKHHIHCELPRPIEVGASCFNHHGYCHTQKGSFPIMSTSVLVWQVPCLLCTIGQAESSLNPSFLILSAAFVSRSAIYPQSHFIV